MAKVKVIVNMKVELSTVTTHRGKPAFQTTQRQHHIPGTTPLVAIALMEMAVSIVCKTGDLSEEGLWGRPAVRAVPTAGPAAYSPPLTHKAELLLLPRGPDTGPHPTVKGWFQPRCPTPWGVSGTLPEYPGQWGIRGARPC